MPSEPSLAGGAAGEDSVSGAPASWEGLTQDVWNPEFWFLTS